MHLYIYEFSRYSGLNYWHRLLLYAILIWRSLFSSLPLCRKNQKHKWSL